jgi:hypothetical protein
VTHDVERVKDDARLWRVARERVRNGFHLSIAASWMCAAFFAPSAAKKRSRFASVQPLPPTQIGRPRQRYLHCEQRAVFFRRRNTRTLAERSPKKPTSREAATKPGSEKRARIDMGFFMRDSAPKPAPVASGGERLERRLRQSVRTGSDHRRTHCDPRKPTKLETRLRSEAHSSPVFPAEITNTYIARALNRISETGRKRLERQK